MHLISGLALVLLSLLGYSAGSVAAGRKRKVVPDLADLLVMAIIWAAALVTRADLGRWVAVGLWLIISGVTGAAATILRLSHYSLEKAPPAPLPALGWKRLWVAFSAFSLRMGNYQSRMLLALFYFLIVFPFGVGVRVVNNPFHSGSRREASSWVARETADNDLESARSQF